MKRENLKPNEVSATLFVGVGGIGSKIIKGVANRSIHDNTENVRFVVLDTDVNDLIRLESGAVVSTVQTSSPRSIKDYLGNDQHAKKHWFPENRILDDKTVSEGAGQIRAISRLAINATVKQGNISTLYKAIDELYLKDGSDKKQAMKIVIASTAAGGTGSGIAMIVGMLVRQYIRKNYPESAAIIRGLLLLPSVMDTVIDTESERESLRRNGYATIKEINAFMMKGSGFFDSVPDLKRYRDLHIAVPTTAAGNDRLECLPFDFCFLMDRADSNQGSMQTLTQYIDSAAQSLYEQNIGPMKKSASSKEDNIVKEFINPAKFGRCRFGGVGASILRYPYVQIRNYVACNWLLESLLGVKHGNVVDAHDAEEKINDSWAMYDQAYEIEKAKYEANPYANNNDKPELSKVYTSKVENDESPFSLFIREQNLTPKLAIVDPKKLKNGGSRFADKMRTVAEDYFEKVLNEAVSHHIEARAVSTDSKKKASSNVKEQATKIADKENLNARYSACLKLHGFALSENTHEAVRVFAKSVFTSLTPIQKKGLPEYSFERYLSSSGCALHPSAVRYLLYKLLEVLEDENKNASCDEKTYKDRIDEVLNGSKLESESDKGRRDTKSFAVPGLNGSEKTLEQMCAACVDSKLPIESTVASCNDKLTTFASYAIDQYTNIAKKEICAIAIDAVNELIEDFERFYRSFSKEIIRINKQKESIIGDLRFKNGDIVKNVCGDVESLNMICSLCENSSSSMTVDSQLFADIFNAIRKEISEKQRATINVFGVSQSTDIFGDVIIKYFENLVDSTCGGIIDKDILGALLLEYNVHCKINGKTDEIQDTRIRDSYIRRVIDSAKNLAAPSIINNNFEERREVSAIAFNDKIEDEEGLRVNDFLAGAERSDTVSRYELRFFRSLYNIMPTQLSKFCDPDAIESGAVKPLDLESNQQSRGDYFRAYQSYMENIGPDCKTNAVITPHIDKRWNSISVMPELDLDYQHALMMNIHQAFFFGLVFENIERYTPSVHDAEKKVYRYITGRDGYKNLIVSNGTKCDLPYEVLDALYFDRAAVKAIHAYESRMRNADASESHSYFETKFYKGIQHFSRNLLVDPFVEELPEYDGVESKTSIFELPVIYYNSLPPQKKDAAEIDAMVDAIIFAIQKELNAFMDKDDVMPYLAGVIRDQFKLLVANYLRYPRQLGKKIEISSNDVMNIIRKKVIQTIEDLDVSVSFIDEIPDLR